MTRRRRNRTPVLPFVRRKRRATHWQTILSVVGLAVLGGIVTGAALAGWPAGEPSATASDGRAAPEPRASVASEFRVDFSACKWGGGRSCVVDGDTLYLEGQKIRLAGIDAPETHDYHCPEELALGTRTAERLRELVNSGPVALGTIDRDEDRYGRKLRNVSVAGVDVGDTLVAEGLARPYAGGRRSWCA